MVLFEANNRSAHLLKHFITREVETAGTYSSLFSLLSSLFSLLSSLFSLLSSLFSLLSSLLLNSLLFTRHPILTFSLSLFCLLIDSEASLFRANSIVSKMASHYAKIVGLPYLWKTLSLPIHEL